MKGRTLIYRIALVLPALLLAGRARAQEAGPDYIPEDAEGLEAKTKAGWHPRLKLSSNFATGQSQDVPGSPDGVSFQLGYLINGELNYLNESGEHEWLNSLLLQLGYTQTPVVDAFIKSVDTIDLRSTYLYHIPAAPWFGPFVAFRLSTSMLPGYDVRGEDTQVLRQEVGEDLVAGADADGNALDANTDIIDATSYPDRVETYEAGETIDLTGAFAPLTLRESAGLFAIPTDTEPFRLDIRLGFGAWETFVGDGYVLEDDEDTENLLELRAMQDSVQAGPELGVLIKGAVEKKLMTYSASALLMQPVVHSADTDLEGFELLNSEFEGVVGFKPWEFFSIDYSFKFYRQPLIVDAWQIQNNILFSLTFDIIGGPAPEAPPCPPCECPPPALEADKAEEKPQPAMPAEEEPAAAPEGEQPEATEGEPAAAPVEGEQPAAPEGSEPESAPEGEPAAGAGEPPTDAPPSEDAAGQPAATP
jgi:hypothetical protein